MDFIKKYKKDILLTLVFAGLAFFAVMGEHFSEIANKPFWWKFWSALAVIGWVVCLGAWFIAFKKDRAKGKANR